jgi:exo-beta-1,3-glucanase (GH17 family)/cellulose synthase/poly-beta-1,6-N-acetylglucosamine synthase-like glycosyltransferase
MGMRQVLVAVTLGAVIQAAGWLMVQRSADPPDVDDLMESISFDPVVPGEDPSKRNPDALKVAQIASDLSVVANYTKTIRTYRSTNGAEHIPALAASHGLNVSVGAWVEVAPPNETEADRVNRQKKNDWEIATAVQLARDNKNVRSVIVGNEALYRAAGTEVERQLAVDELIEMIRRVKKRVKVPVTTGEIWHIWTQYSRLVKEVDYIGVHILPYWEGIAAERATKFVWDQYEAIRSKYKGKRVVIAEFGWPSQGYNRGEAQTGGVIQAQVVRQFLAEAKARGAEYNLVEAFDQQWKAKHEGSVGAYWGIFDAKRQPKFPLFGPVEDASKLPFALAGGVLGALIAVFGLWGRKPRFGHALLYALAASGCGAGIAAAAVYPFVTYMNFGAWVMWSSGFVLMLVLSIITMAKVHEIAAVLLGHQPKRLIGNLPAPSVPGYAPKVSIHIPAYREPAAMLKQTLDACAALDYPNFEVVLVINNTPEEHYWRPVEAHCLALGDRFKFLNIPKLAGFKAGALNAALEATAVDAELIAVLDADYAVTRDWLRDLVPYFADPKVGLIQAPQDHRDGAQSLLKTMMNAEYAGFFDIGMVQRNEDNAIIQHGTMCLVRRSALEQVGRWKHDTIVEDAELGLRLFESGWLGHYTNRRYGFGLLPDTFRAFKTQRHRWAYGAVQIIKKHWRHMLPASRTLTPAQKRSYVSGWFFWLSDALGAFAAAMGLLWVPMVLFVGVLIPTVALSVPIVVAFLVNIAHCALLYRHRVRETGLKIAGAALAAMSLQWTVARAVYEGFVKDGLPFLRTDKGGNAKRKTNDDSAKWETRFGVALAASAFVLMYLNTYGIPAEVTAARHETLKRALETVLPAVKLDLADLAWLGQFGFDVPHDLPLGAWLLAQLQAPLDWLRTYLTGFDKPQAILEQNIFALTLAVQSVPFLATALMRAVERGMVGVIALERALGWLRALASGWRRPQRPAGVAADGTAG